MPCVACNQFVKFADLFETAQGSRRRCAGDRPLHRLARRTARGGRALYRARTPTRDQSYFLFATTRAQLDLLRFPLGEYAKAEVRELARALRPRRSPRSPTARTSASCRAAATPTSSSACARRRRARATSSMSTAACSAATPASSITPSASAAASASAPPSPAAPRAAVCRAARRRQGAGRRRPARGAGDAQPSRCATSTGSARARLADLPAQGLTIAARVRSTRPPVPGPAAGRARRAARRSFSRPANSASRRARPAFSTTGARRRGRVLGGGFIRRRRTRRRQRRCARWRRRGRAPRLREGRRDERSERTFALQVASALDNAHVEEAYARWAPIYDLIFAAILSPGRRGRGRRRLARRRADPRRRRRHRPRAADVRRRHTRVVGVDLSEPMLRRAPQRVARERLDHVAGLAKMDATPLAFPDATFDCVVAPYVLTVVPEPEATLDELARVVRPGGEIVLVQSRQPPRTARSRSLETWLGRHSPRGSAGGRNSPGRSRRLDRRPRRTCELDRAPRRSRPSACSR